MKSYNQTKSEHGEDFAPARPVIRTFYDHMAVSRNHFDYWNDSFVSLSMTWISILWHKCSHLHLKIVLLSFLIIVKRTTRELSSLFRYVVVSWNMKSLMQLTKDSHNVRSIHFHPSGDFLVAGTDQNVIKLYDVHTTQCYVGSRPNDHHVAPINQVRLIFSWLWVTWMLGPIRSRRQHICIVFKRWIY